MRVLLFLLIGFVTSDLSPAEEQDKTVVDELATTAASVAKSLADIVGEDWIVSVKGRTISVESKFDVFNVIMISRSKAPPSPNASRDVLEKETYAQKYSVQLRFAEPLAHDEFIARRAERQKHADILNFGASGKGTWSEAVKGYTTIEVPRYKSWDCDIYRVTTETPGRQIYPLSVIGKIGALKEILDTQFGRERTGND